jgi:hypothetical protein
MIDLKARYGSEYQVRLDRPPRVPGLPDAVPPWPQTIPCLRGHIYARPDDTLGAACPSRLDVRDRLAAIPGVTVLQLGRRDIAVTFPPELFPQVAELMQPRKRRRPSPERAARLAEMGTTLRFPDAPGLWWCLASTTRPRSLLGPQKTRRKRPARPIGSA